MNTIWIALSLAVIAFAGGLVVLLVRLKRQNRDLAQAGKQIETLSANFSALCAGAVGVDRRVTRLEQHGRDLKYRQESIENQGQDERSYGDAIQLVRQGAAASRLEEELGLSSNEANLIVMLHGMKAAG